MTESTSEYKKRIEEIKQSIENEPYMAKMREDIAEGISKTGIRQATVEEKFQDVQDHYEATVQEKFQNIDDQFQAVVENTTGKDVISAPEIILARGGATTLGERLDETDVQLAEKADIGSTTAIAARKLISEVVLPPVGFGWQDPPITIFKNNIGEITTDFDVTDYEITGKTYYVDAVNGSNTYDGLTPEKAFRDIRLADEKADCDVVMLMEGEYRYGIIAGYGNNAILLTKDMSFKAYNGAKVIIALAPIGEWTLTSGQTNTYQMSRSNVGKVCDAKFLDEFGDYTTLTVKTSITEVEATPSSWYTDGTIVYVHTADNRVPDFSVKPYFKTLHCIKQNGGSLYMEGIDIEGGSSNVYAESTTGYFAAKDCTFKYSSESNGLSVLGYDNCYFDNCVVARASDDGFNYHTFGGKIANVIEVDCEGRYNGQSGNIDNGSTMHDGGKIIRVNGKYHGNVGSNVADINAGTQSWNIGCASFKSRGINNYKSNFTAHSGAKVWIEACASAQSTNAALAQEGAVLYKKGSYLDGVEAVEGTGQIISY